MPHPTADLLTRARAGDRDAADRLFEAAAERVLVYVRARLGPTLAARVEPLDVLQETYAEALRSLDRFEEAGAGSFARWLCRIAEHRLLDLAKRERAVKRDRRALPASRLLERARASRTGPLTAAARIERDEHLAQALEELEEEERAAILARHFQGRTLEETARDLGRSVSALRRLLGRAMARLGRSLGEGDPT